MINNHYVLSGLSWIPNFSGNVTSPQRLADRFGNLVEDPDFSFDFDLCSRSVMVSDKHDCRITLRFEFIDDSGMCYIYKPVDGSGHCSDDTELSHVMSDSWRKILQILGDSSPISGNSDYSVGAARNCICTAMDWPIPFEESMIPNRHRLILESFASNSETVTDVSRYVPTKIKHDIFGNETTNSIRDRMYNENIVLSIQSTNTLYMDSFISIYSDEIVDVSRFKSENTFRSRKIETISEFNRNSAQIDNLCLSSNSIRITRWGLIVASVAMGLNILSLVLTNI